MVRMPVRLSYIVPEGGTFQGASLSESMCFFIYKYVIYFIVLSGCINFVRLIFM